MAEVVTQEEVPLVQFRIVRARGVRLEYWHEEYGQWCPLVTHLGTTGAAQAFLRDNHYQDVTYDASGLAGTFVPFSQ